MIDRLTVKIRPHFDNSAYKRIEETGAVAVLRKFALGIQHKGDPATVLEHGGEGKPTIVALHWDFQDLGEQAGSWRFFSRGVGVEAGSATNPSVKFTTGSRWGDLRLVGLYPRIFRESLINIDVLTRAEMAQLGEYESGPTTFSMERALAIARKLAQPQVDYRYGEGEEAARREIDLAHIRVLF